MDKKTREKIYIFHQDSVIFYSVLFIVIPQTVFTLIMIIHAYRIGEIFGGTIISILSIILVLYFTIKKYSNRIVLSKEGIEIKWFMKKISSNKWEDFVDVSISNKLRSRYISFKIKDSKRDENKDNCIEFNINNRKLSSLKELCTNNELKTIIEKIKLNNFFRYY